MQVIGVYAKSEAQSSQSSSNKKSLPMHRKATIEVRLIFHSVKFMHEEIFFLSSFFHFEA